ncbi:MoaD/ThiS family protein [Cyanobium sp. LEGE 06143]|uniref:MoaD/ThiS family protein n=1 Tax=Cyanobium sp. LEGE 06143 TaxID=945727 RepID=UPI0018809F74|nr:MoaD/ThiS family protein [Cyanobium sp. LEGE 06143]MBE9172240.1 MoaD/ThiS family protein [Cyanobium sp. LEGE 06143]
MPKPALGQSNAEQPLRGGGGVTGAGSSGELRVLLFASLRERAGWSERQLALPAREPVTALEIWEQLGLAEPEQPASSTSTPVRRGWPAGLRVAINQRFAAAEQPLQAGDELAFLPPISGG